MKSKSTGSEKSKGETRSIGAEFLVDVDEFINNVAGSFDENGSTNPSRFEDGKYKVAARGGKCTKAENHIIGPSGGGKSTLLNLFEGSNLTVLIKYCIDLERVCLGNEILLNPLLLFSDEPTSGLDSITALRIDGKTMMTTTHQPSGRLFIEFDKTYSMNPAEFPIDLANGNVNYKSFPTRFKVKFSPGIFWGFFPLFTAIFTFPRERAMLRKDLWACTYFLAILPIIVLVIVYLMVGLRPSYIAFSQICSLVSSGLGLIIGTAFMDVKKSVVLMTFMLSVGFFIRHQLEHNNVPFFMSWLRYISFNNYRSYQCRRSGSEPPFIRELRLARSGLEVGAMMAMIIGDRLVAYLSFRRMKIITVT
ncbi:ABC transporter domain-containing protein [Citrus sinensis]|nr:ABC transporter domain-containing protein [Citrus sinensis]